jgi:hypothetical protein
MTSTSGLTSSSSAAASSTSSPSTSLRTRPALGQNPFHKNLIHAGTKRGSIGRDDSDDDEGLEDDDERPYKRVEYFEEEEEEEGTDDALIPSTHRSTLQSSPTIEDEAEGGEDTFLNLLTHFANLHVPTSSTKPEQCPVCAQSYPLSDFADHVYQCLHSLDDVERKEQERLDEKMARQLMAREVRMLDESEHSSSYARDRRESGTDCPDGAECQRVDHQHFVLRKHPEVQCPVCSIKFPVYEVNAHINVCLSDTSVGAGGEGRKEGGEEGMEDEMGVREPTANDTTMPEGMTFDTSSPAFTTLRTDRERKERGDDDSHLPIARDSDDDEDEDEDERKLHSSSPPLFRSSSASPPPSSADLKLTVEQASAVASHIIARKGRYEVSGGNGNDPSLLSLLETFKTLGFTQENLSRLKEQQSGGEGKEKEGGSGGQREQSEERKG